MQGVCQNSTLAPVDNCVFGDGVITSQSINLKLPASQISCQDVFAVIESNGQSISGYCADSNFNNICCQSCKSINFVKPIS